MEEEQTSTEEVESSETENPSDFSIELRYNSEEDGGGNPNVQDHEHVPVPGYSNTPHQTAYVSTDLNPEFSHPLPSLDSWPIFRIPGHLRELDKKAYTPRVVSIGPFHRNDQNLKRMEAEKQRLLKCRLDRFNQPCSARQDLEKPMRELEMSARSSYSETFQNITSGDFVEMMLLDGCFILELMRLCYKKLYKKEEVEDPIFESRWLLPAIRRDLLKLENQLPMVVLQELFDLTISDEDDAPLNTLALQFFQPLRLGKDEMITEDSFYQGRLPCCHPHLLALFQFSFTRSTTTTTSPPTETKSKKQNDPLQGKSWVNTATSLRSSGISFQGKQGRPLDIEFKWGVLKIPTLFVDDKTVTVLRNLMVYEQRSRRGAKPYFTTLAVFFCCIAAIPGDISILREAGIIQHEPGTDEMVVNVLSPLCKEIEYDMDDCCIAGQVEAIDDYTRSWLVKLWIWLKHVIKNNSVRILLTYLAIVQSISLHSHGVEQNTHGVEQNTH